MAKGPGTPQHSATIEQIHTGVPKRPGGQGTPKTDPGQVSHSRGGGGDPQKIDFAKKKRVPETPRSNPTES